MRTYEMVVVLRGDLSDEARNEQLETIQGWVQTNGGSIGKVDHWGRRRLAYQIDSQRDGYYALIVADLPAQAPAEMERNFRISENVVRHLIIREGDQ